MNLSCKFILSLSYLKDESLNTTFHGLYLHIASTMLKINKNTEKAIFAVPDDAYLYDPMVFSFIHQALADGLRNVLIIHGKGREDKSHANIVRSYVARWLTEFDDVQAYCTALPHHGGSGACYVALRKTAQAKQENWERHAKRSR